MALPARAEFSSRPGAAGTDRGRTRLPELRGSGLGRDLQLLDGAPLGLGTRSAVIDELCRVDHGQRLDRGKVMAGGLGLLPPSRGLGRSVRRVAAEEVAAQLGALSRVACDELLLLVSGIIGAIAHLCDARVRVGRLLRN
ncbi:MAG TPA: hypothetical protein VGC45_00030 [Gryllotalpicola sp.]